MHWTQTPEGKKRMADIAAMGRAAQGLAPSTGGEKVETGKRQGRKGKRSPAERALMSKKMRESWRRRKAAATGLRSGRSNDVAHEEANIVAQVRNLAHSLVDAQLNGGLTATETHTLQNLSNLIEQHI